MFFLSKKAARAHWQTGDKARDARDWPAARAAYAKALKLQPSRWQVWLQYGHVAKEDGDLAEAEAAYRTALTINPDIADVHRHLGHVLKGQGRWRDAQNHFQKHLDRDPGAETVRSDLESLKKHSVGRDQWYDGVSPHGVDHGLAKLGVRSNGGLPNPSYFGRRFADYEIAMLNVKNIGYTLARALSENLGARVVTKPPDLALASKACTQADMESDWASFWSRELKTQVRYHRKLWEFCYIAQALWKAGKLKPGQSGLGFGCGNEPLVGVFAKHGAEVLATDRPAEASKGELWEMPLADLDAYRQQYAAICPDAESRRKISFRPVDMRDIPTDLASRFDFCWSACSLEHLGSIELGLHFIEQSLATLKPGGVAVHTTEFNLDDEETIDNWPTVLFQRKHFMELVERLRRKGHQVADLDFDAGNGFLDGFVDMPPWSYSKQALKPASDDAHLKLSLDGFVCTSFGVIVTKA